MTSLEILGHACPLGAQLGAGGMGCVFAVEHPEAGALAVKLLHAQLLHEPMFAAKMSGEARAAALVDHCNVVRVIDHGTTSDGVPFVVMARANGTPLGQLVRRDGPMALPRIRTIARQLLAGIEAIHRAGLVHADLKSDNLLLDVEHDRLTIIDFGLAREARSAEAHNMISGTPEYMAPEQIRGDLVGPEADLYAVGVILYELLTGTTPFGGGDPAEIFDRHLHDVVVPPSLRCPDRTISPALDALILRALAKDPAARFHVAEELAALIEKTVPACCSTDRIAPPQVFTTCGPTREWTRPTRTTEPHTLPHAC